MLYLCDQPELVPHPRSCSHAVLYAYDMIIENPAEELVRGSILSFCIFQYSFSSTCFKFQVTPQEGGPSAYSFLLFPFVIASVARNLEQDHMVLHKLPVV